MRRNTKLPFYKQLTEFVSKGIFLLDNQSISELKQFIIKRQNKDGGFSDRAGNSDLYYSLFSHFILKGFHDVEYGGELLGYVNAKQQKGGLNLVDQCCVAILKKDLGKKKYHGFSILKLLFNWNYDGSLSYRYFLVFLTLDAFGFNNRITRLIARLFARKEVNAENIPCSALAAQMIFRKQLGKGIAKEAGLLTDYFEEKKGFKVFPDTKNADLLSTAVALTALKTCNFDVSVFAPVCLDFLEKNYAEGAFLSGDGDMHRDAEYTFYGLLTLGVLSWQ